jgi:hypothetical protein
LKSPLWFAEVRPDRLNVLWSGRDGRTWTVEAGDVAEQLGAGQPAAASNVDRVQFAVLDHSEQRRTADV